MAKYVSHTYPHIYIYIYVYFFVWLWFRLFTCWLNAREKKREEREKMHTHARNITIWLLRKWGNGWQERYYKYVAVFNHTHTLTHSTQPRLNSKFISGVRITVKFMKLLPKMCSRCVCVWVILIKCKRVNATFSIIETSIYSTKAKCTPFTLNAYAVNLATK